MYKIAKNLNDFKFSVLLKLTNKFHFPSTKLIIHINLEFVIFIVITVNYLSYINQTKHRLIKRISEHKSYVKKQQLYKSAVARLTGARPMSFISPILKIIHSARNVSKLEFLESLIFLFKLR